MRESASLEQPWIRETDDGRDERLELQHRQAVGPVCAVVVAFVGGERWLALCRGLQEQDLVESSLLWDGCYPRAPSTAFARVPDVAGCDLFASGGSRMIRAGAPVSARWRVAWVGVGRRMWSSGNGRPPSS